jgi:glycosyltransferase involved in cell wall biosynthesis
MDISILTATSAWGGAENHAVQLAKALDSRGHRVVIVELGHRVFTELNISFGGEIHLKQIELPRPLEYLSWSEANRVLKQVRADVCVFEKGELESANIAFDFAARRLFKSYIAIEQLLAPPMPEKARRRHLKGILPGVGMWWYGSYLRRRSRCLAPHKIVCVSEAVKKRLIEEYKFPLAKTVAIHNGIDPSRFRPHPEWRSSVRRAWGIPEDDLVFGAVGRLAPIKNFDAAIELFRRFRLTRSTNEAWLVLVGTGPAESQLRTAAKESGLVDWIKFPGPTDRAWEVYNGIDVFLMTSESEGLPLALLEAMASGCCPIAMAVGGVPEVVSENSSGWLIPNGDYGAFVRAMDAAANLERARRAAIAAKGRELVSKRFNSESQIKKIVDIIESGTGLRSMTKRIVQHFNKAFEDVQTL